MTSCTWWELWALCKWLVKWRAPHDEFLSGKEVSSFPFHSKLLPFSPFSTQQSWLFLVATAITFILLTNCLVYGAFEYKDLTWPPCNGQITVVKESLYQILIELNHTSYSKFEFASWTSYGNDFWHDVKIRLNFLLRLQTDWCVARNYLFGRKIFFFAIIRVERECHIKCLLELEKALIWWRLTRLEEVDLS